MDKREVNEMETLQVVEVQGILRSEMVVEVEDIEADEWDDDYEYLKQLPDEVF